MIQLPADFTKWLYVDTVHNRLLLHVRNSADQYFTHVHILDKANTLDEHLAMLAQTDFSDRLAYVIVPASLETMKLEARDQNWVPAPVPSSDIVSLAQYRALRGLPDAA